MEQEDQAVALASHKISCPWITSNLSLAHVFTDEAFGQRLQCFDSAFRQHQILDHALVEDRVIKILDVYRR